MHFRSVLFFLVVIMITLVNCSSLRGFQSQSAILPVIFLDISKTTVKCPNGLAQTKVECSNGGLAEVSKTSVKCPNANDGL